MIPPMLRRGVLRLLVALAMIATPAAAPLANPSSQRIVAVGDLHGDYDAWFAVARAAGLVGPDGHWSGGHTTLVQTGDIVDRGADSLKIIRHLQQLEKEARKAGGRVAVLVGNHEAMMMTGDVRYTTPGEIAAFATSRSGQLRDAFYAAHRKAIEDSVRATDKSQSDAAIRSKWMAENPLGMIEQQRAWAPDGELGRWTIGHPAVLRIGDTLFIHGGLSDKYAAVPIDQINRAVADALRARAQEPDAIINDSLGPLWFRGLAGMPPEDAAPGTPVATVAQQLDKVLALTGAKRIVIGHTPRPAGVAVLEGGRLARIDSGISRAYGGKPGYLEIIGDVATAHDVPRPAAK